MRLRFVQGTNTLAVPRRVSATGDMSPVSPLDIAPNLRHFLFKDHKEKEVQLGFREKRETLGCQAYLDYLAKMASQGPDASTTGLTVQPNEFFPTVQLERTRWL